MPEPTSRDALKRVHLKVTESRCALLEALSEAHAPLSLDEILDAHAGDVGDRATVYRNLQTFVEQRLVSRVRGVGKRDVYEIASRHAEDPEHAHAVCRVCGKIECIEVSGSLPAAPVRKGWSGMVPSLTFWGLCADCAAS